ncbi:hypothetical protein SLE2022_395980 [Rubroshorea leprosula]
MKKRQKIQHSNYFSKLTDSLLFIIVSLLPFKQAARTSVLSKQWSHIWHSTKNIEFNENLFVNSQESEEKRGNQRRVFIEFAKKWMLNFRESSIQNFILTCSDPGEFLTDIHDIIIFALDHNSKNLTLDFSDPQWDDCDIEEHAAIFALPSKFYKHQFLESLKLASCKLRVSVFKFGSLKDLSLSWIELRGYDIQTLVNNCPLLESLSLIKCTGMYELEVSNPNSRLKKLVVDRCSFVFNTSISIDGPQLQIFKYSGNVGEFHIEGQKCIQEAELDFGLEEEFERLGDLLSDLLEQLDSAKVLTVDSYLLQVITHGNDPQYCGEGDLETKHLILKTALHANEFPGIKYLLETFTPLEKLTIEIGPLKVLRRYEPRYRFNPGGCWTKNLILYKDTEIDVKEVEVKGFKGTNNELFVLQYLLVLARSMEQMNIYLSREVGEDGSNVETYRQRTVEGVMKFRRSSKTLRISVN